MSSKLLYTKGTYSNKVLVGDWVISRLAETPPVKEAPQSSTVYSESYTPKSSSKSDRDIALNRRMDFEKGKVYPEAYKFEKDPNEFENFSSTYDLSYNHFPKCYKGPIPRILMFRKECHQPNDEYLTSYGNITSYGITEYKQQEWKDELDSRTYKDNCSDYQREYKPPQPEDYKFERFAPPKLNSIRLHELNLAYIQMKLRHKAVYSVPEEELLLGRRKAYCDPITWECTPDKIEKPIE